MLIYCETKMVYSSFSCIAQRRIQDRRAGRPPPPPFEKRDCLCKFSLYIRKYFDFSRHAVRVYNMYIIHYSSNKNIGYVWRGIEAKLRSKKSIQSNSPGPPNNMIFKKCPKLHWYTLRGFNFIKSIYELFDNLSYVW